MTVTDIPVLVLHDFGDTAGGAPWEDALVAAGWPGPVVAPDLPGHGMSPAPADGNYEHGDIAWFAMSVLRSHHFARPPIAIGVGDSGWAAEVLAVGGRVGGLILVDGLGGPWEEAAEWVASQRAWTRAIADDADALAPPPAGRADPRIGHGVLRSGSREFAARAAAALAVPALVVETGRDAAEIREHFPASTAFVEVDDRAPATVAPIAVAWAVSAGT